MKLRPIEKEDLSKLKQWRNSSELMIRTRQWRMLSDVDQENWFSKLYKDKWPENLMFVMTEKDKPVGVCGLCYINYVNRSAEVSIYTGDKKHQRKGYATKAINELKRIAFKDMDLFKLWAEIYSFNDVSKTLFEKCGFSFDARIRNSVFKEGKYWDSFYYDCYNEVEK